MRLFFSLLKLPFWVFLLVAGGLFYLGELSHRDTLAKNQEMARALAGAPPETVSLASFLRDENVGPADEISVQAVINPDYNYELTKSRKASKTVRYLFVLFDADDPVETKEARGAMVLTEAQKDTFINEYYMENSEIAFGGNGVASVVTLNGLVERRPDLSSMVNDAFEEQNLVKSENFIYVQPFLAGRVAGLTPTVSADEMRNMIRSAALVVALIGAGKLIMRRKKKAVEEPPQEQPSFAENAYAFAAPEAVTSPTAEPVQADDMGAPRRGKTIFIKALAVLVLVGAMIYMGYFAYAAIILVIGLQIIAVRKFGKLIKSGVSKVGAKMPGRAASDEAIMASVQAEASMSTMPHTNMEQIEMPEPETFDEKPKKRRFGLSMPSLGRKKSDDVEDVTMSAEVAEDVETPRRGFKLPMPKLSRKSKDADEPQPEIALPTDADAEARRGFKLALPKLSFKSKKADEVVSTPTAKPNLAAKKAALQSAPLFREEDAVEKPGLADKVQLMMARLVPAEREPKAFAGRPDPFDRLAEDAQRLSAR